MSNKDDQKPLSNIAKNISNQEQLTMLGIELDVDVELIKKEDYQSRDSIYMAAFNVLYKHWYGTTDGSIQRGSPKYNELKRALNKVGLKNILS